MPPDEYRRGDSTRRKNVAKDHLSRKARKTKRLNRAATMKRLATLRKKDHAPAVPSPLGKKNLSIDSVPTPTPPGNDSSAKSPSPTPSPAVPSPPGTPSRETLDWDKWYRSQGPRAENWEEDIRRSISELWNDTEADDNSGRSGDVPTVLQPPVGSQRPSSGPSSSESHHTEYAAAYMASVGGRSASPRLGRQQQRSSSDSRERPSLRRTKTRRPDAMDWESDAPKEPKKE
ncbi:hypothetical protein HRG_010549 [Hirsutella rhossiliensis]|uniref:Uncharacterized protein n=1 Tax=Hirsutella rhossiliensis TaxID=111463 RepID=A0A9P8SD16_9HYPO|nr:uncharacterized protein HRG_10549 [Hirsutella rhossiliensis]KAH0958248.1 hypothetical protein HRG_10549 [Hirsutella rhossiliensis]